MQGKKTYQEKFFVNFRLSARVPAENFYRRLKESLNLDYLRALTSKYYGKEGHKSIDEPLPWHSAISRARQLFGEEVFLGFFRDILRQCSELGLVCGRTQAVDSA